MGAVVKHMSIWTLLVLQLFIHSVQASPGSLCGLVLLQEGQICCNSQAHNDTNSLGQPLSCCGKHGLYNEEDQICCGNLLRAKVDGHGHKRQCCSKRDGPSSTDEFFNTKESHFCCDGIVKKLSLHLDVDDFDCCGKTLINVNEVKCCRSKNGKAKISLPEESCCGADTYDPNTHWCYFNKRVLLLDRDMCGTEEYNVTSEVCCPDTGTVKSNEGFVDPMCEDGVVYDNSTHYWDKDAKQLVRKNKSLCNKEEFNPLEQVCCVDTLYNKSLNYECCGSSYNSAVSFGCCRGKWFDPTQYLCCNNNETALILQDIKCCGNRSYNTTIQVCCTEKFFKQKERPILKKKATDSDCCKYGHRQKVPYDKDAEVCSQEGVVVKKSNKTRPEKIVAKKPNEIPEVTQTVSKRSKSPFCKGNKKKQIEKTCENRRAYQGWIVASEVNAPQTTTLTLLIIRPKRYRGSIAMFHITVPAKCIRNWDKGFIWLLTNKLPTGRKRKNSILRFTVDAEDLLMKDTAKNRKLRMRMCKQNRS